MFTAFRFATLVGSLFLLVAGPVVMLSMMGNTNPGRDGLAALCLLLGFLGTVLGIAGCTFGMEAVSEWQERHWADRLNEVERFDLHQEDFYKRFREYGVEARLKD